MNKTTTLPTKLFFPNLDGLRFFCFLAVFLYHSFATNSETVLNSDLYFFVNNFISGNGILGVNFFFVLSGFLITYLLLLEKKTYAKIDIKSFYIRRILRIWPLFYFCVLFGFIVFPFLKSMAGEVPSETATPLYYIFFVNNIEFVNKGLPDASVLGVLWSVAIEEQFYLFWPLLLTIVPPKKYNYLFFTIILLSFVFRLLNADNKLVLEYHSFSCFSDLTIGALFANLIFSSEKFKGKIISAPRYIWVVLYVAVLIVFLFRKQIFSHNTLLISVDRLIISILFIFVILEQCYANNSFYKMSNFKLVSKLGTYTYGLYCLHMIGILIAAKGLGFLGMNTNVYEVIFLEGLLSLAITICLALVSYHFFEKKFLKLKDRFARITKF